MQLTPINKHFNACDQKWDDMPQQGNGRHCQQCDRVLVDLTDKTEQQVLDLQVQHNFKLCGRYTLDQVHRLDRYLTLQQQPKRSHMPWLVKLAMGLSTSGVPLLAAAQQPLPVGKRVEQVPMADTLESTGLDEVHVVEQVDEKEIGGTVLEWLSFIPIPMASVTLLDREDSVIAIVCTDLDGKYNFGALSELDRPPVKIRFESVGHEPIILYLSGLTEIVVLKTVTYSEVHGDGYVILGSLTEKPLSQEVVPMEVMFKKFLRIRNGR